MLKKNEILSETERAEPVMERLSDYYARLPETVCACGKPGRCCSFMPEITAAEALSWLKQIVSEPGQIMKRRIKGFVAFYLTTPFGQKECPFLEEGLCSAYEVRSFACRAYGLWSPEKGRRRTAENRKKRIDFLKQWKKFRITIDPSALKAEIDYCEEVIPAHPVTDSTLLEIAEKILGLDSMLGKTAEDFKSLYHNDFSMFITGLVLGYKKCVLEKYAVVKELAAGGASPRLERILKRL